MEFPPCAVEVHKKCTDDFVKEEKADRKPYDIITDFVSCYKAEGASCDAKVIQNFIKSMENFSDVFDLEHNLGYVWNKSLGSRTDLLVQFIYWCWDSIELSDKSGNKYNV